MTRIYFTKNTEYHVDSGTCVRVVCRDAKQRLWEHVAVGAKLLGGVRFPTAKNVLSSVKPRPKRGECLAFMGEEGLVLSTVVEKTQRLGETG